MVNEKDHKIRKKERIRCTRYKKTAWIYENKDTIYQKLVVQVTAAYSHPQELALKSQKLPGLLYLGYKKHTLNSRNNSFKHKCVFLLHKPGLLLFVIIS